MTAANALVRDTVYVGCAGWSISSAHRDLFAAGDSMLARYASVFNAVEINSSFYRPHQRKTYQRWAASVPPGFRFSVKVPKQISHEARLHGAGPMLDRFIDEASGLGSHWAGLLLQLPPSLSFDARTAATFLRMLRARWDGGCACEPRHPSWFAPAATELLRKHAIGRVGADPALSAAARVPTDTGPWRYWRWHGSPKIYYSAYSEAALAELARQIAATDAHDTAWVIFDNTAAGHAIGDARSLQALVAARRESSRPRQDDSSQA